jgi:hypothetical protein
MDHQASPAPSADLTVDFRFEMSGISILALIRPAFSCGLKRLIDSTRFPAHFGATNPINLARKSTGTHPTLSYGASARSGSDH